MTGRAAYSSETGARLPGSNWSMGSWTSASSSCISRNTAVSLLSRPGPDPYLPRKAGRSRTGRRTRRSCSVSVRGPPAPSITTWSLRSWSRAERYVLSTPLPGAQYVSCGFFEHTVRYPPTPSGTDRSEELPNLTRSERWNQTSRTYVQPPRPLRSLRDHFHAKGARCEHRLGHESAVGNRYAVKPPGHAAAIGPARCPGPSARGPAHGGGGRTDRTARVAADPGSFQRLSPEPPRTDRRRRSASLSTFRCAT
jgi:hypothetical protein